MNMKMIALAALVAAPLMAPDAAHARNDGRYCREYTKSVRIGGNLQSAYGTACMQPDGSWEMVSFGGHDALYDDLRRDVYRGNGRVVRVERRAPDYWYPAYDRYYARPYYRQPASVFSFYWSDNDRRHDLKKRNHHGRGHWDRNGRGRGHDHHRHGRRD